MLLFVSPSNPTGSVYSPEQTKAIGEWADEHGLWVISDEIYQNLTYDGVKAVSIVEAVPALADRTILVNGVAKTYAMTGWRVGWMVGPADVIAARRATCSRTCRPTCRTSRSARRSRP